MNKIAPENVENLEEDVEQPTTIMKGVLLTSSFLLIAGITVFCITLHVWIGVLVTTGINRVDISELTDDIRTKCISYAANEHEFTKHIHQIWNTKEIPEQFRKARQSCIDINPDYQYTLWTPEERRKLIADNYPWFLEKYDGYSQEIMRINAARYFIIYHFGGMYLDIDMECKVPFDTIIKNATSKIADTGVMLGATIPTGCGTAWILGRKNHPFMELVTKRLLTEYRWYVLPYWTNTISTGVLYMWRTYLNFPCKHQVFLVEPDIQYNVYFNHLHFSSWHRWDAPFFMFFDFIIKHVLSWKLFFCLTLLVGVYIVVRKRLPTKYRTYGFRRKLVSLLSVNKDQFHHVL